ncbi:MAG: GNAT family N-acetyltransferase [Chloroflexi bacterium]|nr:GNAT family N-acetyltransferase [Chloroflexota bacterium]
MQANVAVTPARWWHMPGLTRLIRETRRRRTAGAALVWAPRWSPSLGLLRSVWGATVPGVVGPRSFVAEQDGRLVGLGQMRPRREPHQWDVVYLVVERLPGTYASDGAVAPSHRQPDRRATRLLGELCDAGVALGAERLFARIAEDDGRFDMFRQVGFTPVVREYTYFRQPAAPDPAPVSLPASAAIAGLRPQRRADAFGLLQLYQACTPKVVQMAEGKGSRSWELPPESLRKRLTKQARTRSWVVERDSKKVAWLQLCEQRRGPHSLRIMADERAVDLHRPLVEFALETLGARLASGVLMRVREHQSRLTAALEDVGFEPVDAHVLMVKQLAAPVLERRFTSVLEKVM